MGVSTLRPALTEADLRTLFKGESADDRAIVTHRLCRRLDGQALSDHDRKTAEDVLRFIARDTADQVRRALALTLRNSPALPRDVAKRLALDIEAIAAPILENSPVFSDADLVEVLAALPADRHVHVAKRSELGEAVTDLMAMRSPQDAVETALRNPGAAFSLKGFGAVTLRFDDAPAIQEALIDRDALPAPILERLVNAVSGAVFDRLVEKHALPPQLAIDLATRARERATIDLVTQAGLQDDHRRFVQQLHLNGRLTASLILRALCLGHIRFVEHAFAELAGIPHEKAWLLVHDGGGRGLMALYQHCGLPPKHFDAYAMAITVLHETDFDGGTDDRARFTRRMIERVLTAERGTFAAEDLAYLLERLDAGDPDAGEDSVHEIDDAPLQLRRRA
jgi:uncharacterized protein (DUF2336 family)